MAAIFYQQRILQCLQCFDFSNGLIRTESLILNVVQGLNLLNTLLLNYFFTILIWREFMYVKYFGF